MMTNVYFLRHGETDYNRKHRLQGQRDISLNETGRRQARETGAKFREKGIRFTRVYSSPLDRARETASLASGWTKEQVMTDDRLIEIDFGPIEGHVYEKLAPRARAYVDAPWDNAPVPGIESSDHLVRRTGDFLRWLARDLEESESPESPENVLIVTHGMALHGLMVALPGASEEERIRRWGEPLSNCSVFRSVFSEGVYSPPERLTKRLPTYRQEETE
ncbi:histidine phosphatase family protein [uncultured Eubacterium sp.]|uniref:histidine phosphatase family protein n=1 Tax=uncultured Eubacterium sp. TaxID=165185 RepID=UPI000E91758F|nr:histidine phosphatase family protein [uncultured Eubacterium sp.]HAT81923.1 hypothetical protein [Eubacterium sp.]